MEFGPGSGSFGPMLKRRWFRWLLAGVVLSLIVDQALQYTVLRDGRFDGRRIAPFDPPLFNAEQEAAVAAARSRAASGAPPTGNTDFDPDLGWCTLRGGGAGTVRYDELGARLATTPLSKAAPDGVRRIVAVGGSFTHGDEVAGTETWAALIARRDDLEIANLGVGGYGVGQALLRLERDGLPLAPDEVWLGLLPSAALRVTNVYRPALRHQETSVAFKPRFLFDDDGELMLAPCPARSLEQVAVLASSALNMSEFGSVKHDMWMDRSPAAYAPAGFDWTHYYATTRLWITRAEGQRRDPAPWLLDGDSEVSTVLHAVIQAMAETARAAGARFRVLVLPDRKGLAWTAEHAGSRYWQRALDALDAVGIEVFDTTDALLEAGALEDDGFWQPQGHYSPLANTVVADAILGHVSGTCAAGSIDALDYFALGPPRDLEFARVDKPAKRKQIVIEADSDQHWTVSIPRKDGSVDLVFALAGDELTLDAFEITTDRIQTGRVQLERPARVGTATSCPGGWGHTTGANLQTTLRARLLGKFWQTLDVSATGSVHATWSPAEPVTLMAPGGEPGTTLDDVVGLKLQLRLDLTAEAVGIHHDIDYVFDGVLARGRGYVQFVSSDHVYVLVEP